MTIAILSREYPSPFASRKVQPTAMPAKAQAVAWTWRTVCDTAVGLSFLALLAWELCRIGNELILLADKLLTARMGGLF